MWCIVKIVPGYSNITKRYMFCLHEKYEILSYRDQEEFLTKGRQLYQNVGVLKSFSYLIRNQTISVLVS